MTTERIIAVSFWTLPAAAVFGYLMAAFHLKRIAQSDTAEQYPEYIQRATELYRDQNTYVLEDEFLDDK